MKLRFSFTLLVLLLASFACNDDDPNGPTRNIVGDGELALEELLIVINLKASDSTYWVPRSIDSVRIRINNMYWTEATAVSPDVRQLDTELVDGRLVASRKVGYFVSASQSEEPPAFETAKDYVDYLAGMFEAGPGEYLCYIDAFVATFENGTTQKFYPNQFKPFVVERDKRSVFVGEFDIIGN